jgi:hypothetical protein
MGVDGAGGIISVMTNHDLSFRTGNNSEKMRITAGGNVGIGTTNPQDKLDVNGVLRFNGNTDRRVYGASRANRNTVVLDGNWDELEVKGRVVEWTGSNLHIGFDNNHADHFIEFGRKVGHIRFLSGGGTAETMRITGGKVGIGTPSPDVKLHIIGGSDAQLSGGGFLVLGSTGSTNIALDNNEIMARNNGQKATLFLQANGGDLSIHSSQAGATRFIVRDNGRVGIGTSNPGTKLHIIGNRIRLVKASNSSHFLDIRADGSALDIESRGADLFINNHGQTNTRIRNFIQISSKSLKDNITSLSHGEAVSLLCHMRPVKFHFKDDETQRPHIGFISEEVPTIVATTDRKGLRPTDVLAILTRVVQEQQVTITRLLEKVEEAVKRNLQ